MDSLRTSKIVKILWYRMYFCHSYILMMWWLFARVMMSSEPMVLHVKWHHHCLHINISCTMESRLDKIIPDTITRLKSTWNYKLMHGETLTVLCYISAEHVKHDKLNGSNQLFFVKNENKPLKSVNYIHSCKILYMYMYICLFWV